MAIKGWSIWVWQPHSSGPILSQIPSGAAKTQNMSTLLIKNNMKITNLTLLACFTILLGLVSCKKDKKDDPTPEEQGIAAMWKLSSVKMEGLYEGKVVITETLLVGQDFHHNYIQFTSEGNFKSIDADDYPIEVSTGTYKVQNDEIMIIDDDDDSSEADIVHFKRTGDKLELTMNERLEYIDGLEAKLRNAMEDVKIDELKFVHSYEKTDDNPMTVTNMIIGTWQLKQVEYQGLINDDEAGKSIILDAGTDGAPDVVLLSFSTDGKVKRTSKDEEQNIEEVGTFTITDGIVTMNIDGDDDEDGLAIFKVDGEQLVLLDEFVAASEIEVEIPGDVEYEMYNVLFHFTKLLQ